MDIKYWLYFVVIIHCVRVFTLFFKKLKHFFLLFFRWVPSVSLFKFMVRKCGESRLNLDLGEPPSKMMTCLWTFYYNVRILSLSTFVASIWLIASKLDAINLHNIMQINFSFRGGFRGCWTKFSLDVILLAKQVQIERLKPTLWWHWLREEFFRVLHN